MIIEDDQENRDIIQRLLSGALKSVGIDEKVAIVAIGSCIDDPKYLPGLYVLAISLDYNLPVMNGDKCIPIFRRIFPNAKIFANSSTNNEVLLNAGADEKYSEKALVGFLVQSLAN